MVVFKLDFFLLFFFDTCFGTEAHTLAFFVGTGTSPKLFSITGSFQFVYDTRYLSASFSAQIASVLNLCDSPVAGSVIISAALVPALSLLLNELFKFVVSVNKELANSFQLSHSSFFSSRAISLSWSDAFLTFKAHEHVNDGLPTFNP